VKEIVDEIGRESRTIWKNLLIICPTLCIVRERVKKQRTTPPRSAAKQISGSRASTRLGA
jgi:hypothetical protein